MTDKQYLRRDEPGVLQRPAPPADTSASVVSLLEERLEQGRQHAMKWLRSPDAGDALAHADLAVRSVEQLQALTRLDPYLGRPDLLLRDRGPRSFQDRERDERITLHRALTDVTTGNLAGLLPTTTGLTVGGSIDPSGACPFVTAYARPGNGFTISYPLWTLPTAGQQTAEKTQVATGSVTIDAEYGTWVTFGFGLDIARQAIDWADRTVAGWLVSIMGAATNAAVEAYALGELSAGLTPTATTRATFVDDVLDAAGDVAEGSGVGPQILIAGGNHAGRILAYELGRSSGSPPVVVTGGLPATQVLIISAMAVGLAVTPLDVIEAPVPLQAGIDAAAYRKVSATRTGDEAVALLDLPAGARTARSRG